MKGRPFVIKRIRGSKRFLKKFKSLSVSVVLITVLFSIQSCIVVKRDKPQIIEVTPPQYTKAGNIPLSGDVLLSINGDFGMQVPKDWSTEVKPPGREDIQVIATDPTETLYLVITSEGKFNGEVSEIDNNEINEISESILKERLSRGSATRIGDTEANKFQDIIYSTFQTTSTGGGTKSRNAVFVTPGNNIYAVSLLPMNDILNSMPPDEILDQLFDNLLLTVMM